MYEKITLTNGVRIMHERMEGVRSASIGIWVGVGSRYEKLAQAGNAHYIEHMLFKGTSNRSAAQLAEEMDSAGGQINAYTTRDATCFYARVLDSQLPLAIDVLSDMFFNSLLDDADVKSELGIILEEIDMYEDTPEDLAAEQLLLGSFKGALGRPVLGRASTLTTQSGESLRTFKRDNYIAPRIVVALAGSFTDEDLRLIESRFSALPKAKDKRPVASSYSPHISAKRKSIEQSQLVLGFPGLPTNSEERFAMQILSGILGGNASSRLFQSVRERHGLCYSIYSFTASFVDTGLFAIATAVGRDSEERALGLIADELRRMSSDGVTEAELSRTRSQIEASVLMSLESTGSRMNRLGGGELYMGKVLTPEELIARYNAVTREDILAIAQRTFSSAQMSISAVGRDARVERYQALTGTFD